MKADDLVDLANVLAKIDSGNPRQASLKRSISTSYFALFHALSQNCVDRTIGSNFRSDYYWQIVTPIYRLLDHGSGKRTFQRILNEKSSLSELKQIARAFIKLQEDRISADYDPGSRYTRKQALDTAEQATTAIKVLRSLPLEVRMLLAVQLVARQR